MEAGHPDKYRTYAHIQAECPMAKKKGGFGRFVGAIAGSPYERLMKLIQKTVNQNEEDEDLAREISRLSKVVEQTYADDKIDADEHDLLMEELEDFDPEERKFIKVNDDEDEFYSEGDDVPDAPKLRLGKSVNLDDLMKPKDDAGRGSFGKDEFEEYRERMKDEFFAESEAAVREGYRERKGSDPTGRVFGDTEDDALETKRRIAEEVGIIEEDEYEEEEDDSYRVDEDGTEWWEDEDGDWWYREPGKEDWEPYEE